MICLLASMAMAADPIMVPAGSSVAPPIEKSWLLTDGQYTRCLAAAQDLPICRAALDTALPRCASELEALRAPLEGCAAALQADQTRDDRLTADILNSQELRATDAILIQRLKSQRNVAYIALAGSGLVVGGAVYLALAVP